MYLQKLESNTRYCFIIPLIWFFFNGKRLYLDNTHCAKFCRRYVIIPLPYAQLYILDILFVV